MSSKVKAAKNSGLLPAFIFFIPALVIFLMWVTIGWQDGLLNEVEKTDIFLNRFPGFIQNFEVIHIASILLSILAIYFASGNFRKKKIGIRVTMMLLVMFSIFIILFDVVQLI